jgi:hypothetical protein
MTPTGRTARSIGAGVQFSDAGTPFYTQVFGWD